MDEIKITPECEEFLFLKLEGKQNIVGISLGIKDSGCSKYRYDLGFTENIKDDDLVFGNKVKVVVSQKNMRYLKGTVIDCVADGLGQIIKFKNPNADNECGCGESFAV